ncbi:hypothetical protein JST97_03760 [bacterium]|nr:hypothetical protein [bacterium]
MTELEQLLADHSALKSAGPGRFSLDPRRQRELLQRLGLQDTAQGFLKLFQGICRAEPSGVSITAQANHLRFAFVHHKRLPEPLWDGQHPLALAILNLSQEYALSWEGESYRGQADERGFQSSQKENLAGHSQPSLSLTLTRPGARWWHRDWTPSVRQSLNKRLAYSLITWLWNEQPLAPVAPLSSRAQAVVLAQPECLGDLNPASAQAAAELRVRGPAGIESRLTPGFPAHALLGLSKHSWSETSFVLDGVLLDGERNLLDRPGVIAVISAEGLTPALNGLELVHDAAFRQRLQALRPEVSWLDGISQRGR